MLNVFDCAYCAAQREAGAEAWERLSDIERMQAIARQIGFSLLHWDVDVRPDPTFHLPISGNDPRQLTIDADDTWVKYPALHKIAG